MFYAEFCPCGITTISEGDTLMGFDTREERDEMVERINADVDIEARGDRAQAVTVREVAHRYDVRKFTNDPLWRLLPRGQWAAHLQGQAVLRDIAPTRLQVLGVGAGARTWRHLRMQAVRDQGRLYRVFLHRLRRYCRANPQAEW